MTRFLLLALWLCAPAVLAQPPAAPPGKAALERKTPKAPNVVPRNKAMEREERRMDTISKASKRSHDKAPNAIRNER